MKFIELLEPYKGYSAGTKAPFKNSVADKLIKDKKAVLATDTVKQDIKEINEAILKEAPPIPEKK